MTGLPIRSGVPARWTAALRGLRARRVMVAVGVLAAWQIAGELNNPVVFPPVSAVAVALVNLIAHGGLLPAMGASLKLLAIGFGVAFAGGSLLGILLGRYRLLDVTLGPYVSALYATPAIALVPLILVWFGFGLGGRVTVVFLASFFPILINTYAGVRDAPGPLIEVARSLGVTGELGLLRKVIIPSAVPFIMAGVRLSIGRGVVGMAVAEVYLRLGGIGALIVQYGAVFRTDYVIAAILPLPILGIGLTRLSALLEARLQAWRT
ncbi:MAG TPA: ABC transporter permease [Mycobacteriales bacterium]|nr:ABC transporter permease [Mycobacteriales bacterium]